MVIAIQPFEGIDNEFVKLSKRAIGSFYGCEVKVLPVQDLPDNAWYDPRSRYWAPVLLDYLDSIIPPDCHKIVGITDKDISTTKGDVYNYGIMGLGRINGAPCVVSTYRIKTNMRDHEHLLERTRKVVLHEVGHTMGVRHCMFGDPKCFMQDCKGKVSTVDKADEYMCVGCSNRLK